MVTTAPVNAATLKWARQVMCLEPEDIAHAAKIKLSKALAFETGEAIPTLRQLENIAKKLDRTVAFFFTPPPESSDVPTTPDFRGRSGDPLPPSLVREIRRADQYRATLLELRGKSTNTTSVGAVTWRTFKRRASDLRAALNLAESFVPPGAEARQVFAFWRNLLEGYGYLILQTTRIPLDIFRGFSIQNDELPLIVLNGSDSDKAKTFTLFHEVAHLANRTGSLCQLNHDINEEAVANAFAAEFLMPEDRVKSFIHGAHEAPQELSGKLAKRFKVSTLAAGVRLKTLKFIEDADLEEIRKTNDAAWADHQAKQKAKPGGPQNWQLRYRDLGNTYVGAVAQAVEENRLDWLGASYALNANISDVDRIFQKYYETEGRR